MKPRNNKIGPTALICPNCGVTVDRADCGLDSKSFTLHCPGCAVGLDTVNADDMRRRGAEKIRARQEAQRAEWRRQADLRAARRRRIRKHQPK